VRTRSINPNPTRPNQAKPDQTQPHQPTPPTAAGSRHPPVCPEAQGHERRRRRQPERPPQAQGWAGVQGALSGGAE